MKHLEEYFEKYSDYVYFLEHIAAQIKEITFDGERKIEVVKPVVKSGSAIFRVLPYKKLPKEGYYLSLQKMGKIVLDKTE